MRFNPTSIIVASLAILALATLAALKVPVPTLVASGIVGIAAAALAPAAMRGRYQRRSDPPASDDRGERHIGVRVVPSDADSLGRLEQMHTAREVDGGVTHEGVSLSEQLHVALASHARGVIRAEEKVAGDQRATDPSRSDPGDLEPGEFHANERSTPIPDDVPTTPLGFPRAEKDTPT